MKKLLLFLLVLSVTFSCFGSVITRDNSGVGNSKETCLLIGGSSSTFTDISKGGTHTFGLVSDPVWSSGQTTFGKDMIHFDGNDALSSSVFGAEGTFDGDFTIDGFIYITSLSSISTVFSFGKDIPNYWFVRVDTDGEIRSIRVDESSSVFSFISATGVIQVNTLHHYEITRYDGIIRLKVDGVQVASVAYTATLDNNGYVLYTGTFGRAGPESEWFNGYQSEVRITPKRAIWKMDHKVPNRSHGS